jgi:hypothetical protein
MKELRKYSSFNQRRYSNPWVAILDKSTAKIDFKKTVGGYTGGYNKGEEGVLFINNPIENDIYAYGQKDYRSNKSETNYVLYKGGNFIDVEKSELVKIINETKNESKPTATEQKQDLSTPKETIDKREKLEKDLADYVRKLAATTKHNLTAGMEKAKSEIARIEKELANLEKEPKSTTKPKGLKDALKQSESHSSIEKLTGKKSIVFDEKGVSKLENGHVLTKISDEHYCLKIKEGVRRQIELKNEVWEIDGQPTKFGKGKIFGVVSDLIDDLDCKKYLEKRKSDVKKRNEAAKKYRDTPEQKKAENAVERAAETVKKTAEKVTESVASSISKEVIEIVKAVKEGLKDKSDSKKIIQELINELRKLL